MKTKPLEEKLKKMNEGVLSVELVEAPESKLPVPVEELVDSISSEEEGGEFKEIQSLCRLTGIEEKYKLKLENKGLVFIFSPIEILE